MNYTAGNVYKAIDALAPFGGCMEWDNVGLLVGTPEAAVSGVLVTLDVTPQAVETARQRGLNCIVSHHPVIFHPLFNMLITLLWISQFLIFNAI